MRHSQTSSMLIIAVANLLVPASSLSSLKSRIKYSSHGKLCRHPSKVLDRSLRYQQSLATLSMTGNKDDSSFKVIQNTEDSAIQNKDEDILLEGRVNGNATPATESKETPQPSAISKVASYKDLIIFISTTIVTWLSEPLLSLVDTTIVGKFGARASAVNTLVKGVSPETIQLAALGPATMLCDNAVYMTYFVAMATTNQLALASAKDDKKLQVKTTSNALGVASILGLIITLVIFARGDAMLQNIIGSGGAMVNGVDLTEQVISSSWDYAKIRGIVAPLTIMGMIAQAVSLATLDTRTPAVAVVVASVVNVLGDLFLVAKLGMGVRGAAIATAAASAASSFVLIKEAKKKIGRWQKSDSDDKQPFISLPDLKSFVSLSKLAGPIFFVILGKIICYSAMTLRSADFGMMSLATHNIMLRVFFFFCVFGDSFSLAAQSFLPKSLYSEKQEADGTKITNGDQAAGKVSREVPMESKMKMRTLLKRVFKLASGMAIINACASKLIMVKGGAVFTNDGAILSLLRDPRRVFFIISSVFFHPIVMASEGSLLASRDLRFLVGAYGFTVPAMLCLLKYATFSFTDVWRALFSFQMLRVFAFGGRVLQKTRIKQSTKDENL